MSIKEAIRIATEMVTATYNIDENGDKVMAKLERSNAALREFRVEKALGTSWRLTEKLLEIECIICMTTVLI